MISVAIIGTSAYSRMAKKLVSLVYNPYAKENGGEELAVTAFYDPFATEAKETLDNAVVLTDQTIKNVLEANAVGAFLFPQQPGFDAQKMLYLLRRHGVPMESVYFISKRFLENGDAKKTDVENFLISYYDAPYLPYLEFHIEDACNLNCKACEHYSPLVKKSTQTQADYEKVEADLRQLKTLISDIGTIRILGGEPLLNPELPRYVYLSRNLYPDADVMVVTNALLLNRLPEETYDAMRKCGAAFMVSLYPPLKAEIDDIISSVKEKGVTVFCSPLIEAFSMKQNLDGSSDRDAQFARCFQAGCHNVYRGKIAACFLPFTTRYFNEAFRQTLPEDGAIDLYEAGLTTHKLKERLDRSFERCRYCELPVEVPWQQAAKEPVLSDWVVMK